MNSSSRYNQRMTTRSFPLWLCKQTDCFFWATVELHWQLSTQPEDKNLTWPAFFWFTPGASYFECSCQRLQSCCRQEVKLLKCYDFYEKLETQNTMKIAPSASHLPVQLERHAKRSILIDQLIQIFRLMPSQLTNRTFASWTGVELFNI